MVLRHKQEEDLQYQTEDFLARSKGDVQRCADAWKRANARLTRKVTLDNCVRAVMQRHGLKARVAAEYPALFPDSFRLFREQVLVEWHRMMR